MEARRFARKPARRRLVAVWVVFVLVPGLTGASHRSSNFVVDAPTPEMARQVADQAEAYRASIARAWLGQELPAWTTPCPIRVKITAGEAGGLTSFGFHKGKVSDQSMTVEGRFDRILASSLPHEVTHTVFAAYFGGPMPRWADEGASLLSEDLREHQRHDRIVTALFARQGPLPLDRLFTVEDYPRDLMGFYGQGYSIARFLVEMGGRPRFLQFVKEGATTGWDDAARKHYGLAGTRELDRAWRSWHKVMTANQGRPASGESVAARTPSRAEAGGQ
jgi:hypothetical protein